VGSVAQKGIVRVQAQGEERRDCRKVRQLHYVQPNTPLTQALGLLLEAGVSVLPVIDEVRTFFGFPGLLCLIWHQNSQ